MDGIPIVVPVRFATRGTAVQATSGWLSLDTMFVRCDESPAQGSAVVLRLFLPGVSRPQQVEGVVGESIKPGEKGEVGFWVRCLKMPAIARKRIKGFLSGRNAALQALSRRAFPRAPLCREISVTAVGGASVVAHSQNISRGGVFVAMPAPPALHEIVELEFNLPDGGGPLRTRAVVVQRVLADDAVEFHAGAGLQFIGADDLFRQRIDACLDGLLALSLTG